MCNNHSCYSCALPNLTQPECNDMETIYRNTVDRGILLLGLDAAVAAAAGRDLRGRVHCAAA